MSQTGMPPDLLHTPDLQIVHSIGVSVKIRLLMLLLLGKENTVRGHSIYIPATLLTLILLTGCKPITMNESLPVVCASFSEVITKSPLAQQEAERLSAVRDALQKGAKDAELNYKDMTEIQVAQARQADATLINNQWLIEQQGARNILIAQIKKSAAELTKKEGYGMIIDKDGVMACAPERDVTSKLVSSLKAVKLNFGSLPVITPVAREGR